ncbi:aspartyl protease family protein [Sulfurisphaera ohwakuensis]|uniref:aspartyl protease family protein n=1 Tax=Sulfurisphaera ohwakuensis TaxID=69656 RepID=UPI0036F27728
MRLIYIDGIVKNEKGDSEKVRFLIDSGAFYTVLRKDIWEKLGLKEISRVTLVLADGSTIERGLSEAIIELPPYGERHSPVILGESEDENLLGVVTLEIFGLVLDPLKREIRQGRILLK